MLNTVHYTKHRSVVNICLPKCGGQLEPPEFLVTQCGRGISNSGTTRRSQIKQTVLPSGKQGLAEKYLAVLPASKRLGASAPYARTPFKPVYLATVVQSEHPQRCRGVQILSGSSCEGNNVAHNRRSYPVLGRST
jgi:hypothetical protein